MATKQTAALQLNECTTAVCVYCGEVIQLDVTQGGGDPTTFGAWDWGSSIPGIDGLDYGCGDSPDTDADGTGGHSPIWKTITPA